MNIIDYINHYFKFLKNYFFSAKYERKGKCKMCGKCCREIVLYIDNRPIISEKQFERLKEFDKHFNCFYISGKDENGALLFTCKELRNDNKCGIYMLRGLICRTYPMPKSEFLSNGAKMIEGCGYYFVPNKDFKTFLNNN